MSDIVLLRKLTEKSTLKFGQYCDVPIFNLLNLNKTTYLRWVYYNCSNITFMEDILLKIGILENEFIEKPGKNPELHELTTDRIREKMTFKGKSRLNKLQKINIRNIYKKENKEDRVKYSKSSLMNKNHGH